MPNIAVIIPAFRSEKTIGTVIRGIPGFVNLVVVIEDAGDDRTIEIVKELAKTDSRIKLVCHELNQGVGGAVLTGYKLASQLGADIIVKMDSDGQMDAGYLSPLIAPIVAGKADYTKGNRFLHARELKRMPHARRIGNVGLSFLNKIASGYWNVFDPTNGYTAIHAKVAQRLGYDRIDRRYFFEISLLLELGIMRAVVKDVYIPGRYEGEKSYLSTRSALWEFPRKLLRGIIRRFRIQYFIRDFNIASLFLCIGPGLFSFGLVFGIFHWIKSAKMHLVTPTGTIMLAVLSLVLGIQLMLQALALDVQSVPTDPISADLTNG